MRITAGTTPAVDITDRAARLLGLTAERWIEAVELAITVTVNPAAGAVLSDTLGLNGGLWRFVAAASASAAVAGLELQHRNAANGATLGSLPLDVPVSQAIIEVLTLQLAATERLRIVARLAAGANVQTSILGYRVN